MNELSSVILCGGKSRRMGRDKARLPWGGREMLDVIASAMPGEVFLSADSAERFGGRAVVVDRYPGCGPLGGICTALEACRTPLLFVVCCDMPLVAGETAEVLCGRMDGETDAAVPREASGRVHPLCAVYRKEAAPALRRQLEAGNFRMRDALCRLRTRYVPAEDLPGGVRSLANINTLEEYRAICPMREQDAEKYHT